MDENSLIKVGLAYAAIGLLVAAEHRLVGRLWAKYELARRAMGIATVLACLLPVALLGGIDTTALLICAGGFIIAGAVLGGMVTCEKAGVSRKAKRELDYGGNGGSGPQLPG